MPDAADAEDVINDEKHQTGQDGGDDEEEHRPPRLPLHALHRPAHAVGERVGFQFLAVFRFHAASVLSQ